MVLFAVVFRTCFSGRGVGWKIFFPEDKINGIYKNKIKQEAVLPKAQKIGRCCKIKNKPKDKNKGFRAENYILKNLLFLTT